MSGSVATVSFRKLWGGLVRAALLSCLILTVAGCKADQLDEEQLSKSREDKVDPRDSGLDRKIYRLTGSLSWVTTGLWVDSGPTAGILLVDTFSRKIVRFDETGRVKEEYSQLSVLGELEGYQLKHPSILRNSHGINWLLDKGKIFLLSENLEVEGVRDFSEFEGRFSVAAIYDFVPLDEGVVAAADVTDLEKQQDFLALVYLGSDEEVVVYEAFEFGSINERFFISMDNRIAVVGDTAYALLQDSESTLLKLPRTTKGAVLNHVKRYVLPSDGEFNLTRASNLLGAQEATDFYRQIENSTLPFSLHTFNSRLYLLSREEQGGVTYWWLSEIDLDNGTEVFRILLPSKAPHLIAIPGSGQWAFIEKGHVEGLGASKAPYMSVDVVLIIREEALKRAREGL